MERDIEKTKISYFHNWIDSEGMAKIESWKNKKTLLTQVDYDALTLKRMDFLKVHHSEEIAQFLGMNSIQAMDKAINSMNEEGKELTVDFLLQELEIENCNAPQRTLSQLDSNTVMNFAAYDWRQNKAKSNKSK